MSYNSTRLYIKVGCAQMYERCRLISIDRLKPRGVTEYSGESDVILGFYLSMLKRRHFPYIGVHRE